MIEPYYQTNNGVLFNCDALIGLREMAPESVDCCVTSPPYYGLRDYGTATWEGGDAGCDHRKAALESGKSQESSGLNGSKRNCGGALAAHYRDTCGKCGAKRIDAQIGLEETPEAYVAKLVEVFGEVKRVLRDDGTLWLNLAPSYSSITPNIPDCLNRILKGCTIFGFDSDTVASASKGVTISPHNKRSPDVELPELLCMEVEIIEDRDNDFSEIIDCLTIPRDRRISADAPALMCSDTTAPNIIFDMGDSGRIIVTDLDAHLQAELTVLRPSCTGAGHSDNTTLAVKEPSEPRTESGVRWHATWDSFTIAAGIKSIPNINFVNQAVALRNGALSFACLLSDFKITHASEQKVTFTSVSGGIRWVVSDVRHLLFSFVDGSVIPYSTIYNKANRLSNKNCAKQEIDTPNMVKTALQEEGWICRQTIIWHKPNPMPESVTDRPTKAHEYIFLLSKNKKYFYDAEAVREPNSPTSGKWGKSVITKTAKAQGKHGKTSFMSREIPNTEIVDKYYTNGRNKRSVWTVTTKPFKEAHFATFPPDLITPCIKAGSSEYGVCADCGKPWERVVEKDEIKSNPVVSDNRKDLHGPTYSRHKQSIQGGQSLVGYESATTGWQATCKCKTTKRVPATVLDPFGGAGTTAIVAEKFDRSWVLIELSTEYCEIAKARIDQETRQQKLFPISEGG